RIFLRRVLTSPRLETAACGGLLHDVHTGRYEIDAEGGPQRQRPIEEMNGKVASNSTVREPAPPQLGLLAFLVSRRIKGHCSQQEGKAEAHASPEQNGKVGRCGQSKEFAARNDASSFGSLMLLHPL